MNKPYGYDIKSGYIGFINGQKKEYPTEEEYLEALRESGSNEDNDND